MFCNSHKIIYKERAIQINKELLAETFFFSIALRNSLLNGVFKTTYINKANAVKNLTNCFQFSEKSMDDFEMIEYLIEVVADSK